MKAILRNISEYYNKQLPFVAYHKPNDGVVKFIYQNDNALHYVNDFSESGFVFAPFENIDKTVLIPLENLLEESYEKGHAALSVYEDLIIGNEHDKVKHEALVQKGIEAIVANKFQKVVLSRIERIESDASPVSLFKMLLSIYPSAFVYLWYHPKVGCWLGATPEVLLQVHGNRFKTMALAGTQLYSDNLLWGEKEQEEQQLVTDFIADCLASKKIAFKAGKPYTVRAGNLAHIRTDIEGNLDRTSNSNNLTSLIKSLHPTPAVCGLPKDSSQEFILENEGYDRSYYTGFLGELNFEKSRHNNRRNTENQAYRFNARTSSLFVNLRCMQVQQNECLVYVGGGITASSVPSNEFEETCNKAKTMGKVISAVKA